MKACPEATFNDICRKNKKKKIENILDSCITSAKVSIIAAKVSVNRSSIQQ